MIDEVTQKKRPSSARPRFGWTAWEATLGYIAAQHSRDAILKLVVSSDGASLHWSAILTWAGKTEAVEERSDLGDALSKLWHVIERHHRIFHSPEAAVRRPSGYASDQWFDESTLELLNRLLHVSQSAFRQKQWLIVILYYPAEHPDMRVQMRLLADQHTTMVGARGPALREACRQLYQNAAPVFAAQIRQYH